VLCAKCGNKSNLIFVTSKYGDVCLKCMRELDNSIEKELERHKKRVEMYKKYGISIKQQINRKNIYV